MGIGYGLSPTSVKNFRIGLSSNYLTAQNRLTGFSLSHQIVACRNDSRPRRERQNTGLGVGDLTTMTLRRNRAFRSAGPTFSRHKSASPPTHPSQMPLPNRTKNIWKTLTAGNGNGSNGFSESLLFFQAPNSTVR